MDTNEACKSDEESIPMLSNANIGDSANDIADNTDKLHFECHVCQKSYDTKYLLQSHMLTHKGKKPYTCVICDEKTFTNCEDLRNHLALHFKEEGVLCYYCNKMFPNRAVFNVHISTHSIQDSFFSGYSCKHCTKSFKLQKELQSHMECKHTTEHPSKCDECKIAFRSVECLNRHISKHNDQVSNFSGNSCKYCKKSFTQSKDLRRHMHCVHTMERPFRCDQCELAFNRLDNLNRHRRKIHQDGSAN